MTYDAIDSMRHAIEKLEGARFAGFQVQIRFAKPGDLDPRVRCYRVTAGEHVAAIATDGMVIALDDAFASWITERLDEGRIR